MIASDEILKIVRASDDVQQTFEDSKGDYQTQIREMSRLSSLSLDADLARAQRVIVKIRRDLEKAREET